MTEGTTQSGFAFSLDEAAADNMELLDVLAEADGGSPFALSRLCTMLLGEQQKKRLYDHLRTSDGRVPIKATMEAITEIMRSAQKTKN